MEKKELKIKKELLEKELREVDFLLSDYDYQELAEKYGDKFSCKFCRYDAVFDLSCDGNHYLCGSGNCTCCHANCVKYKPDNEASLLIKNWDGCTPIFGFTKHSGKINKEEYHALEMLQASIFDDEPSDYTLTILKMFLTEQYPLEH